MTTWVFDLDGVLQEPAYPHPKLIAEVSEAIGVPYDQLFAHYSTQFNGNAEEEAYHLSLCGTEEQKKAVRGFWRKMHEMMPKAEILPAARELLEEISSRDDPIFAWTKGSISIQRDRLKSIGLLPFFPLRKILHSPRKGTAQGLENDLLPNLPDGRKVMVGDSFEQDIQPALGREDFLCIWVSESASYANKPKPKVTEAGHPNLVIVRDVQELLERLKRGEINV